MKKGRMLLWVSLALFAVFLALGCATGKYVPKAKEELYGTWTNETLSIRKIIYSAGKEAVYYHTADTTPLGEGTVEVVRKWTDSQHNTRYKVLYTGTFGSGKGVLLQFLIEISKSGTVYESVFYGVDKPDPNNYPTEISQSNPNYALYKRQVD